jgi:CarD family transcriptional regulator
MFSIGDTVCYPLHGVGTIEAIEERDVLGKITTYYVLRLINTRLTAMLPVDNAESVGLRRIITKQECEELFEYYRTAQPCLGSANWNQRYRDNMDKLRTGDPKTVVDVMLCLGKRNSIRTLSSGERKMLSNAKSILCTEISVVLDKQIEEIEAMFD